MKLGVIYEARKPDWPIRNLQDEARNLGFNLRIIKASELSTHLFRNMAVVFRGTRPWQIDGVIVRGFGWPATYDKIEHRLNLLSSLEESGTQVMNPVAGFMLARDKERSLSVLATHGFKVPETHVCEDLSDAMRIARKFGRLIVKPLQGSRGLGVISVSDEDSAFHVLRMVAQTSGVYYLQRFVSDLEHSLRIFIVGEEPIGCILLRPTNGRWKTNAAQGAIPSLLRAFEREAEIAVGATKALGLWYAGVDIMVTKDGEEYLCEVNASPSWRVFSKVTGVRPGERILRFLAEKTKEKS